MQVDYLLRKGLVVDIRELLPDLVNKRYPNWLYALAKQEPSVLEKYASFLFQVSKAILLDREVNMIGLWSELTGLDMPSSAESLLARRLRTWLKVIFPDSSMVVFGEDYFFYGPWLVMFFVSTSPIKAWQEIILSVFSLCARLRQEGKKIEAFGVLFLLQEDGFWMNLSDWSEKEFLDLYSRELAWREDDKEIVKRPFVSAYGNHLLKEVALQPAFKSHNRASQIFISNPQGRSVINRTELERIRDNLPEEPVFCHGKYIYNLCSNETWAIDSLKEELEACAFTGLKGCVIHCGKSKDRPYQEALLNMEQNMKKALQVASKECPLILETSARQGSEILSDADDLVEFYTRFPDKNKVKICVDTCHVFAAGYDPLYFISFLEEKHPGSVVLVHFNDSQEGRSSCKDRHASPGLGRIGYERMKAVYAYCSSKGIPLVHE
ncbi:AP-endonuclease type 2 [Cedratvirus kamchatka]|uniref:AP-endonuclease type 2 n=1 Tax=Cedratvirus kamchatka TaxID=2716914 RepID=A0A6G8MYB0_9VIRU|nr:AP-endonuclease type 2 [Cedratvirus kamchatka]